MRVKVEWTVPNILTLLRLSAIPFLCWLIWQWPEYRLGAFILFLAIWFTDLLDGFIARRFNQMTEFGKLFDPLVDKIFQIATAITMFLIGRIPVWVPVFLLVREGLMILGSLFALKKLDKVVYSSLIGKLATLLFVAAFGALFWVPDEPRLIRDILFVPPVLVSTLATVYYAARNLRGLSDDHTDQDTDHA